jgi:hypothetical protein
MPCRQQEKLLSIFSYLMEKLRNCVGSLEYAIENWRATISGSVQS